MKAPISWIKDFVDFSIPVEELAERLTMTGLEVDGIQMVGLAAAPVCNAHGIPRGASATVGVAEGANRPVGVHASDQMDVALSGLAWEPDKLVVGRVDEVMPHPNADRLVLCRLFDGEKEHVVLTGATNLFEYKGKGPLEKPLKVAYAKEGARIYDGHQPGQVLTTLKPAKIRGVDSYSMICSEKELGISDEHEGVIILDDDAPEGMPLVDYMGDAVLDISILPNMIRNASILGIAREIAAMLELPLKTPELKMPVSGTSIRGQADIKIEDPTLNPRFVLGLIRNVKHTQSPYQVQRRLKLAGMRPISAVVDATNYVMLETGEPMHAFDYDVLVKRAGGKPPTIITRTAKPGEKLVTLDGVERVLDDFTELVTDTAGVLSIAGVMGGLESEVSDATTNVLLEGASWNFINIRKTVASQKLQSEAAYRMSRGVHPELALMGTRFGLDKMAAWAGGEIAADLIDNYPQPYKDPLTVLKESEVTRSLGIHLGAQEIAGLLTRLGFTCQVKGDQVEAQSPPHRMDIGEGLTGKADLIEEVARLYGYDNIPASRLADPLPPQVGNPTLDREEKLKDLLARMGFQEIITYRLTTPEKEQRVYPPGQAPGQVEYISLKNPITPERAVMRTRLLPSVLEIVERNARTSDGMLLFEAGPVYLFKDDTTLPEEPLRLVLVMCGLKETPAFDRRAEDPFDFFDLKGALELFMQGAHIPAAFESCEVPAFHPGKCACMKSGGKLVGHFGELHPLVAGQFEFAGQRVMAAELDMDALLDLMPVRHESKPVPAFPPILEDLAMIIGEEVPAGRVEGVMRAAGGQLLESVRLFDIYRGEQIGPNHKSLAYSLTYRAPDRTLTDKDAAQIRQKVIKALENEVGARIRSQ
jgi:phenylalanyl-tRNA synthetase beta chain